MATARDDFIDIVTDIETRPEDRERKFNDFCDHHNDKEIKDLVCHADDRTDDLNWKFMGRSLITRKTFTLLHYAVAEGRVETVKLLISKGADPAAVQQEQGNVFHFATLLGSGDKMLKTILDAYSVRHGKKIGSDVLNKANFFSWTPLFYAIKRKDEVMVKYLLENGADPREEIREHGSTAFLFAARHSSAEIFGIMMDHCFNLKDGQVLDDKTKKYISPYVNEIKKKRSSVTNAKFDKFDGVGLHTLYACSQKSTMRERNIKMVEKLLYYGADPTQKDEKGQTGLHYAVQSHDESILEKMLQNEKIDNYRQCKKATLINEKDDEHQSPLWYAFFNKAPPNMVKILMQNGARITESDPQAREMLRTLIENENYVGDLLENIAEYLDINWFEDDGIPLDEDSNCNLFQLAIALNKPAKLRILLHVYETTLIKLFQEPDPQIDAHLRRKFPYHVALKWGCSPDMIDLLKERKCMLPSQDEIKENDPNENSPLHCLNAKTCRDSLKRFMDIKDAETKWMLRHKNKDKKTPLDIAMECKRLDILRMFVIDREAYIHPSTLLNAVKDEDKESSKLFVTCGENIFELLNIQRSDNEIDAPQRCIPMKRIDGSDDDGEKPFIQLIKSMPDMAMKALDHCHSEDEKEKGKPQAHRLINDYNKSELHPLEVMVKEERIELLEHSVVAAVIADKWCRYGLWFYVLNLLTYIIYLVWLSALSQLLPNPRESVVCRTSNGTTLITSNSRNLYIVLASLVIIFAIIRLINEVIQFILTITKECKLPSYLFPIFNKLDNYLEMFIFISAIVISVIVLSSTSGCLTSMIYNFTMFIVALSWINLILFLSKLPFIGVYALIFISMVKTFLKLALFALLLVIGSTLVLVMLFSNPQIPRSPFTLDFGTAMVKVITMVTGELGFEEIFTLSYDVEDPDGAVLGSRRPQLSTGVAYFMWIIFLVFMPILLSNMLTGLAVGDVEKIIKDATFTKIKDQVEFMMNIEQFMSKLDISFYKEVRNTGCMESSSKFVKRVLWDDGETEDATPKNYKDVDFMMNIEQFMSKFLSFYEEVKSISYSGEVLDQVFQACFAR